MSRMLHLYPCRRSSVCLGAAHPKSRRPKQLLEST